MAKLIERIGAKTMVDGKPIDLSTLANVGTELIKAHPTELSISSFERDK